jgi:DNA-binding NarL/FixJ family response regulator
MSIQQKIITVLIADDHEIMRRGIRQVLVGTEDIQVVGEAADGNAIKRLVIELCPQILLLDLIMPESSPFELAKWIRANCPALIMLVLTAHGHDRYLAGMMEAGAAGYLDKNLRPAELIDAIRAAAHGEIIFNKEQLERAQEWREEVNGKWERLSHREREVLLKLMQGVENKALATSLGISINTVEKHLENIYKKLEVTSRAEAIHWWVEKNT